MRSITPQSLVARESTNHLLCRIENRLRWETLTTIPLQTLLRVFVLLLGCGMILVSSKENWFDIPATSEGLTCAEQIQRRSPPFQSKFQFIVLSGSFFWGATFLIYQKRTSIATLVGSGLLLTTLAFPYFVLNASPELSAEATWLQMQHDNLTWLGGDINLDAENGYAAWKSSTYWVDAPRQVRMAPIPNWSALEFGLDKLDDVLAWLGYSNVFCQFARSGWFHALLGSLCLTCFSLFSPNGFSRQRAATGLTFLLLGGTILSGVALSAPFRIKSHLALASQHLSEGDLKTSLDEMRRCTRLLPPLAQDSYFISQRALIEWKLGARTDYSELHHAKNLESNGKYDQSFRIWKYLCDSQDLAIRRESLRAVLRFAIQDYNCNRFELARQRLEYVLAQQPGNVKIIYYLQNLSIRLKDPHRAYELCDWMYQVTQFLNFQSNKTLRAVSERNAMLAASLDSDEAEVWVRTIRAKQ